MIAARTTDILNITGGESATVARTLSALEINERPGRGSSRVFDFAEALAIVVYIELARKVNHRVAREVALNLLKKLTDGDLFDDPVAIITSEGLSGWISSAAIDDEYMETYRKADPLVVLYRLPVDQVRSIFDPVAV